MFYSRKKKFSVYKDYVANDVLLSDATFHQEEEGHGKRSREPTRKEIDDILTLGDITNVTSAGHASPSKKAADQRESKRPQEAPNKVVKPQRSRPKSSTGSVRGGDSKAKGKKRKTKPKKKLEPRPTAFHSASKHEVKPIKENDVFSGVMNDGMNDTIIEGSDNNHDEYEAEPKSNSSLEIEEVPFILTKSSVPSIQLSEFYQPPRSTSTPYSDILQTGNGTLKPLTPIANVSASQPIRPLGYSTPIFHFSPNDKDFDDTSLSDQSVYGGSISRLMCNESPLSNKISRDDKLFGNISSLTHKLRNSISLKEPQQIFNDVDMSNPSQDDPEEGHNDSEDKEMTSPGNLSNITDAGASTMPHSILKAPNSRSGKPKKSVRIDESTLYSSIGPLSEPPNFSSKRKAEIELPVNRSNKKAKNGNNPKYEELLALCGKEKDPLDLISR